MENLPRVAIETPFEFVMGSEIANASATQKDDNLRCDKRQQLESCANVC